MSSENEKKEGERVSEERERAVEREARHPD